MSIEKVAVAIPGQGLFVVDVECRASDGDDEIALRMAGQPFPLGSIFTISGVKWQVTSKKPPKVVELKDGRPVAFDAASHADAVRPAIVEEDRRRAESAAEAPTIAVSNATPKVAREPLVIEKSPTTLSRVNDQLRSNEPAYKPGEVWKPRDPRRKSGFTIKAVTATEVIADDGRTVQLERMKRYEKVG